MRSLFVMDPLERIVVAGDSTYALMLAAADRGWDTAFTTIDRLWLRDGRPSATWFSVVAKRSAPWFDTLAAASGSLDAFDVVWMRKDPPTDDAYLSAVRILAACQAPVVNRAGGLLRFHEKLWTQECFSEFQPTTLVVSNVDAVRTFAEEVGGPVVLKPVDGNGGRGVLVTHRGDRNLASMVELLTREGRVPLIAQRWIEQVEDGDKRILLFNGEPAGAVLRRPHAQEHRANLHVGGTALPCDLTARDLAICAAVGPTLRQSGQVFVGIDVIGEYLTEINVTSPTGIQEISRWTGRDLASELLDVVVALAQNETRGNER